LFRAQTAAKAEEADLLLLSRLAVKVEIWFGREVEVDILDVEINQQGIAVP
jgi:hypothetical protein